MAKTQKAVREIKSVGFTLTSGSVVQLARIKANPVTEKGAEDAKNGLPPSRAFVGRDAQRYEKGYVIGLLELAGEPSIF